MTIIRKSVAMVAIVIGLFVGAVALTAPEASAASQDLTYSCTADHGTYPRATVRFSSRSAVEHTCNAGRLTFVREPVRAGMTGGLLASATCGTGRCDAYGDAGSTASVMGGRAVTMAVLSLVAY